MSTSTWRIVRAEPSEKMLDAAARASMKHLLDYIHDPKLAHKVGSEEMVRLTHASRYRTMLSASDAPTQVLTDADFQRIEAIYGSQYDRLRAVESLVLAQLKGGE